MPLSVRTGAAGVEELASSCGRESLWFAGAGVLAAIVGGVFEAELTPAVCQSRVNEARRVPSVPSDDTSRCAPIC